MGGTAQVFGAIYSKKIFHEDNLGKHAEYESQNYVYMTVLTHTHCNGDLEWQPTSLISLVTYLYFVSVGNDL